MRSSAQSEPYFLPALRNMAQLTERADSVPDALAARGEEKRKKRKAPSNTRANRAPKRVKKADALNGLPYDIQYEIFSHLTPLDLCNLAVTSTRLRTLINTPSTGSLIWKSARSNIIPPMPECPPDLTDAQFAEFVFCRHCHFCGNTTDVKHSFSIRKRICDECVLKLCEPSSSIHFELHPLTPAEMRQTFPWVRIDGDTNDSSGMSLLDIPCTILISSGPDDDDDYTTAVFVEVLASWTEGYNDLETTEEEKKKWLQAKLDQQRERNNHALICGQWFAEYQKNLETEAERLVIQRTQKIGWAAELSSMPEPDDLTIEMVRFYKDEILKQNWAWLDSKITSMMERARLARFERERFALLEVRLPTLKIAVQAHLKATTHFTCRALYPTTSEVFLDPTIQTIILNTTFDDDVTVDALRPTISSVFGNVTKKMNDRLQAQLYEQLRIAGFPGEITNLKTVFNLATTVFLCCSSACGRACATDNANRVYWYKDLLNHRCSHVGFNFPADVTKDGVALKQILKEGYRSFYRDVKVDRVLVKLVMVLLNLCGLSKNTTKTDMDDLDPIFECVNCHDAELGRPTMSWKSMLRHYRDVHEELRIEPEDLDIVLIRKADAKEVRKRLADVESRNLRVSNTKLHHSPMMCVRCEKAVVNVQGYSWYNVTWHMATKHNIDTMTDADVVVSLDATQPIPIYYMWPPRPIHYHNHQVAKDPEKEFSIIERVRNIFG